MSGRILRQMRFRGAAVLLLLAGCHALEPYGELAAVPARQVPLELLAPPRSEMLELSIGRLRQSPPDVYRLAAGDVLGVYIENVLGESDQPLPVHSGDGRSTPSLGFPIPVRDDGTVSLPLSDPIMVAGLSIAEATEQIRHAYTVERRILPEGKNYVSVTLMRPREYQVVVIRAEAAGAADAVRRPSGAVVNLPAYENDVLHALSATGGLPGPDARNEIVIFRGGFQDAVGRDLLLSQLGPDCDPCRDGLIPGDLTSIRIPLRYHAGQVPMFTEQDITLRTGDVVMIAARDHDRFYTDGAIPGGEHILPRDRDLDVLQAIALAGGSDCERCDVGCPACEGRTAIVVRKVPCGGQIPIRVDLERALSDPRERILIQPDDLIIVR